MDILTNFLGWFLRKPIGLMSAGPRNGVIIMDHSSVSTMVLYRNKQFQVEFVLMKPNSPEWPGEHRHPNIDSYEVALYYPMQFIKNGQRLAGPEMQVPIEIEGYLHRCDCVRLLPTDWHGAPATVGGAAILSVQHWLNDVEPTSVGLDWEGQPTTAGHKQQLDLWQKQQHQDSSGSPS